MATFNVTLEAPDGPHTRHSETIEAANILETAVTGPED
jgi:hypothetical protein